MAQQRILILGAGFGGVYTARALRRHARELSVEIIDDDNYFVFQPLLPEVAGSSIDPTDAVTPLRLLLPTAKVREAEVTAIDFHGKQVEVVQGMRRTLARVPYDHLVIAVGQQTDLSRFPGLTEHSLTIKNLADAFALRNRMIDCLEQADLAENDIDLKRRMLTFTVLGGGLSGVETIGEMEHMVNRSLRFYPRIRRDEIRFILVEYAPRILMELPEGLSAYTARKLHQRGIEVYNGVGVKSAAAGSVELSDGRVIQGMTLVATIGSGPTALIAGLDLPKQRGKVVTDRFLKVPGVDNVWAVGDVAAIPLDDRPQTDKPAPLAPPTAQAARQEAVCLAANLHAAVTGSPAMQAFTYKNRGALASLGGRRGVAELMGRQISGFPAWVLWRFVYLALLPSAATRARVGMNWLLDALLPRNIVQIEQLQPQAVRRQRFRAGDVVFRQSEATGPVFIVLSGSFRRDGMEPGPAVIGEGGYFGEGVLHGERSRRSTVTAIEESYCLLIEKDDFELMANHIDGLRSYIEGRRRRMAAGR